MFTSKWKLIGFLVYLVVRLAVTHPVATATMLTRQAVECRLEPGHGENSGPGPMPSSRYSNATR